MAGFFDFLNDPSQAALYAAGTGLLDARQGQVGRALMGAMPAYAEAEQNKRRNQLVDLQNQHQQMQMDALKRQLAQQARIEGAARGAFRQQTAYGPPGPAGEMDQAPAPQFDQRAFLTKLSQIDPLQAMQMMAKKQPLKLSAGESVVDPDTFQPLYTAPNKDSQTEIAKLAAERDKLPQGHPMRPVYDQAIEKAATHTPPVQVQNFGSPVPGINPLTGKPELYQYDNKGTTPKATGIAPVPPATDAKITQDRAKNMTQSKQLLAAAQEAKDILNSGPTESGVGALADKAANFVGGSFDSGNKAQKLETLSGWMTANVPRMEGPQSDADVRNYKIMAAQIGDRRLPVETRKAALETVIKLQQKYQEINGGAPAGGDNSAANELRKKHGLPPL